MHWKMRNAQLKPGYNVQIGVDSEYIVSKNIFQDRNDVWTLIPFLKTMEEKPGFRYPSVTADSGYGSEGIAQSSNLMILQHSLFILHRNPSKYIGNGADQNKDNTDRGEIFHKQVVDFLALKCRR